MTEQTPTPDPSPTPTPEPIPTPGNPAGTPTPEPVREESAVVGLVDPSTAEEPATTMRESRHSGYAVYNDTLRQFASGVLTERPSKTEARKLVPEGHDFTVREV